jgi:hypothetical protein
MARTCTICQHPERTGIDLALTAGEPYRRIAQHFAASPDAVLRHQKAGHVAQAAVDAHAEAKAENGDRLQSTLAFVENAARTGVERMMQLINDPAVDRDTAMEAVRTAAVAINQLMRHSDLVNRMREAEVERKERELERELETKRLAAEDASRRTPAIGSVNILALVPGGLDGLPLEDLRVLDRIFNAAPRQIEAHQPEKDVTGGGGH